MNGINHWTVLRQLAKVSQRLINGLGTEVLLMATSDLQAFIPHTKLYSSGMELQSSLYVHTLSVIHTHARTHARTRTHTHTYTHHRDSPHAQLSAWHLNSTHQKRQEGPLYTHRETVRSFIHTQQQSKDTTANKVYTLCPH